MRQVKHLFNMPCSAYAKHFSYAPADRISCCLHTGWGHWDTAHLWAPPACVRRWLHRCGNGWGCLIRSRPRRVADTYRHNRLLRICPAPHLCQLHRSTAPAIPPHLSHSLRLRPPLRRVTPRTPGSLREFHAPPALIARVRRLHRLRRPGIGAHPRRAKCNL